MGADPGSDGLPDAAVVPQTISVIFEEGTFEIFEVWDEAKQVTLKEHVKKT